MKSEEWKHSSLLVMKVYQMAKNLIVYIFVLILLTSIPFSYSQDDILDLCSTDIEMVAWNPSSDIVALQSFNGVWLYDTQFNPVAYLNQDNNIIDIVVLNPEKPNEYSTCWGTGLAWSLNGSEIATTFYNRDDGYPGMGVKIWDVETSQVTSTFLTGASDISSVKWSLDGQKIAAIARFPSDINQRGTWAIAVWDLAENPILPSKEFGYSPNPINSIAWSPDSIWLASVYNGEQINIWNTNESILGMTDTENLTEDVLQVYDFDIGIANDIAWNNSGDLIAIASEDHRVYLWNNKINEESFTLEGHEDSVNIVDWNADGTLLASAGDDATIRIWDTTTGEQIAVLEGHEDSIHALDWSPDDQLIATASRDNTVRIWHMEEWLGE